MCTTYLATYFINSHISPIQEAVSYSVLSFVSFWQDVALCRRWRNIVSYMYTTGYAVSPLNVFYDEEKETERDAFDYFFNKVSRALLFSRLYSNSQVSLCTPISFTTYNARESFCDIFTKSGVFLITSSLFFSRFFSKFRKNTFSVQQLS